MLTGILSSSYLVCVSMALGIISVESAALVGCSLGGRVALELAIARPERVSALVLVGAGLPGWSWSEEVLRFGAAEDEAMAGGDLDNLPASEPEPD